MSVPFRPARIQCRLFQAWKHVGIATVLLPFTQINWTLIFCQCLCRSDRLEILPHCGRRL